MEREPDPKTRTANGTELDAVEHPDAFDYRAGQRAAVKAAMNRRHRRETREILRGTRHE